MKNKKYLAKFTKFVRSVDYYKYLIPQKYKRYKNVVTSLYLDKKIEKQSEVHKLLTKLINARGTGRETTINCLNDKKYFSIPSVGIKSKNEVYSINMEINTKATYLNQSGKEYTVNDRVVESLNVKAKNERDAKLKAKVGLDFDAKIRNDSNEHKRSVSYVRASITLEDVNNEIMDVNFVSVVNSSTMKPVAPSMQWLEASSNIVQYNWLPEERKYLNLKNNTCVEDI